MKKEDKKRDPETRMPKVVFDLLFKVKIKEEIKEKVFTENRCVIKKSHRTKENIFTHFDKKLKDKIIWRIMDRPENYDLDTYVEIGDLDIIFVEAIITESFHNYDLKVGEKISAREYDLKGTKQKIH